MGAHVYEAPVNPEDNQRALDALRRIVQALRVSSRASERSVGMSTAQLFVLRQLALAGPCSISELATRTLTHPSSVSVVVTRLVNQGLAERHDAADDRRRAEISCTPAGRLRLADGPALVQDRLVDALAGMAPPTRRALADGLEQLASSLDHDDDATQMFFEETEERPAAGPAARPAAARRVRR